MFEQLRKSQQDRNLCGPHECAAGLLPETRLERAAVEVRDLDAVQIDALDAAHVDRRHLVAFRIAAVRVRMNAAGGAEAMLDRVLVELVDCDWRLRR